MPPSPQSADHEPTLDPRVLEALRRLSSEQGEVAPTTDDAILSMARARLGRIRHQAMVKRVRLAIPLAAACLALALFITRESENAPDLRPLAAQEEDEAVVILREVSTLFPGLVRAIQRDESGLSLVLATEAREQPTMGVVIEIQKDGRTKQIITFPGQTIQIGGHAVQVEASGDGRIRLKGMDIDWSSDQPELRPKEFQIHARAI